MVEVAAVVLAVDDPPPPPQAVRKVIRTKNPVLNQNIGCPPKSVCEQARAEMCRRRAGPVHLVPIATDLHIRRASGAV